MKGKGYIKVSSSELMDIKIYTSPTCHWCKKLKEWLKKKRLAYIEHDVVESETARDEVIDKSGKMALPLIEIDGQVIVGFDEKRLEALILKEKTLAKKKVTAEK